MVLKSRLSLERIRDINKNFIEVKEGMYYIKAEGEEATEIKNQVRGVEEHRFLDISYFLQMGI